MWGSILDEHSKAWRENLPLTLGVRKELLEVIETHIPDESYAHSYKNENYWTREFFERHFQGETYLRNLITNNSRYNLDGTPNGEITEAQKERAQLTLDELLSEKSQIKEL